MKVPGRSGKSASVFALFAYQGPFKRRPVVIKAPMEEFLREYGFDLPLDFDRL
jgi:hypothetical protein